jgi:peptidoglycan/xylan/chitin deacetylase (PgdA/CDA1 family)
VSHFDEHEWNPELFLSADALRARFQLIRDGGYNVIPLREAAAKLQAGTLPPRSVALTFDDGTHDFFATVVPLLQEFGYPATVYVTTYYAEKQTPVFSQACRYLLWCSRNERIPANGLSDSVKEFDLRSPASRDAAVSALEAHLASRAGGVGREVEILAEVARRVGVDFDAFLAERRQQIMTPSEIRALPRDLVEVQLHTHRHRVPLRKESFLRELADNKAALASWRATETLDGFCYPSGVTDDRFLPWLRELNVGTAVTCVPGLAMASTNPLLLPRVVDSSGMTRIEFEGWLTGFGSLIPRMPRRRQHRPSPVYD